MRYTTVSNPKFTAHGGIELTVNFDGIGLVPFHATPDDITEHGRELYARALAGDFGPVAPYVAPDPSPEDVQKTFTDAIQRHMDAKARERNYDGILSLCTYATSTDPKFAAEGQAGVEWRDACWAKGFEIIAEVQAGTREIPTVDELLAELPVFRWPDEVTPR
jgi:hypothetical protein